jgi:DNA-binding NarL/FixJ family response regulator
MFLSPQVQQRMLELDRQGETAKALSTRERQVLALVALGRTTKEIARALDLSPRTVETYRKRLMDKLGLNCLADVVRYAVRIRIIY